MKSKMEKQTAVEYLFQSLFDEPKDNANWYAIFFKAKVMEQEQTENAYSEGYNFGKYGEEPNGSRMACL
jgi:hypothetical protein